ncbi:MAG: ATP-binding protein [Granulosicoccus sp.]
MKLQADVAIPTRILLVEDNEDDRLHIEHILASGVDDYTIVAFSAGGMAVDSFDRDEADCIILDYRLGPDDGISLLSEFKRIDPYVPVIMLTGQGNEELASLSIKSGASDYLVKKTLNENSLRAAIHNAIRQADLERKVAMQADEQSVFLEVLVHDLKAPLLSIQELSEVAIEEEEAGSSEELKECLQMQNDVARRASDLVKTLENYALLDAVVEFLPVCLTTVAHAAKENLRTLINNRNANITIGELPTLIGHAPQLTQLLQNLMQNGLKYNESELCEIELKCSGNNGKQTVITVTDNGIGIPSDSLSSIFKPFKRLWSSSEYEGSGIGLATCSKIVGRHRGRIWCTSTEGHGSCFHISLPLSSPDSQRMS